MTLAARLAPFIPLRLVAAAARLVYPRFEPELARLPELCPPDCGTAVDVGGWYGPWTRRLSDRAGRVVTVEPVPHLARLLTDATPGNVRVVRAAASDHQGTARLWLPPGDQGDRGVSSLIRRDIHARALDVPCVTLDSLDLHDVGFVKIDVDGNELAVLHGATALLTRDRPALFIELEARIQPIAPVVSHLAQHGYEGWVLPGDTWLPLSSFDLEAHQAGASHVVSQGLLRRVLPFRGNGYIRYVNSVLFLPDGRRPGERLVRDERSVPDDRSVPDHPSERDDGTRVREDGTHARREATHPPLHPARLPARPAAPHGRPQSGPGRGSPS